MSGSGPVREMTRNRKVDAALQNEQITRERVTQLEHQIRCLKTWHFGLERQRDALQGHNLSGFMRRLRWLVTGR